MMDSGDQSHGFETLNEHMYLNHSLIKLFSVKDTLNMRESIHIYNAQFLLE